MEEEGGGKRRREEEEEEEGEGEEGGGEGRQEDGYKATMWSMEGTEVLQPATRLDGRGQGQRGRGYLSRRERSNNAPTPHSRSVVLYGCMWVGCGYITVCNLATMCTCTCTCTCMMYTHVHACTFMYMYM